MRTGYLVLGFLTVFALAGVLPYVYSSHVEAQTATSAIIVSTQGTLPANGQYNQSTGTFFRVVQGTPTPTPSPTTTPCVPTPGAPGGTIYFGSYSLSNGESGTFVLSVEDGSTDASGSAAPQNIPRNPVIAEQGPATVNLQINTAAGTGSGSINLISQGAAVSGPVTITSKFPYPPTDPTTCGTPTPTPNFTPTPTPTPTPASATVSGKVLTPENRGLKSAVVSLTDFTGIRRTTVTNSFGIYVFNNVGTNNFYTAAASSKRYRFVSQGIFVTGDTPNIDFVGLE